MKWELCLICSALIIVTSVILAIIKANVRCKSIRRLIPKRILFFGTVLSTFVLVIPITVSSLDRTDFGINRDTVRVGSQCREPVYTGKRSRKGADQHR